MALHGPRREDQHQARLTYLRSRPDLLVRLPGAAEEADPTQERALDDAVRMMRFLQYFPPTAAPQTVRWSIRLLVSEIHGDQVSEEERRWAQRGDPRRI